MIPKHVLAQLEEHTSMGFLLFYTDKDGNPKQHFHFDCDIAYHGLASYAKMVLDSLASLDREGFKEFILEQINGEDDA